MEAKLTQTQLAEKLNTTQRRISYFEKGEVEPDLTTLCNVCRFFDISSDYLIGLRDY